MAVRDFIHLDRTTTTATHAPRLLFAVDRVREAIQALDEVKAVMDHSQDGSTFTDLEALFGVPSGKGQAVYDLINGTRGAMAGTFQNNNTETLVAKVG